MRAPQRNVAIAAGAVLIVVLVIVGLSSFQEETLAPAASASPSAAAGAGATTSPGAATPTAAPTATGLSTTGVASARYGYINLGQNAFDLRTETGDIVQTYGCGAPGRPCDAAEIAASPDGKRIAFWDARQLPQWTLMVVDTASPLGVRPVATIPAPQLGGTIVWSTDSQGILYSALVERVASGPPSGPASATIDALDVATGQTQADVMPARSDGTFYLPLAWDRAKGLFAAVRTGEGGFIVDHDVADPSGFRTSKPPDGFMIANQVEASPDATRVLVIERRTNVVRIWPIDDATKAFDVGAGAGRTVTAAHWMPDSRSVAWSFDTQFGTFIPQTDSSRVVYAAPGGVTLVALRPDGTAALLATTGGAQVTDMQSGTSTRVRLGGQVLARSVLLR